MAPVGQVQEGLPSYTPPPRGFESDSGGAEEELDEWDHEQETSGWCPASEKETRTKDKK